MIRGVATQMKTLRAGLKEFERQAMAEVAASASTALETALRVTPVWEGETVRNYRWGKDGAVPMGRIAPVGGMPPGPTNDMPLGAEPRRPANEAAARGDMAAILKVKKLTTFTLTNTVSASKWDLIDNGSAPGGPGQRQRGPGGVSKLAEQAVRARGTWK